MEKAREPTAIMNLIRTGDKPKFYASPEWRRLRKEALNRDRSECIKCKANGIYTRAQCVHHIKEIEKFPHLALSLGNLESLCHSCHDAIHGRELIYLNRRKKKIDLPERW